MTMMARLTFPLNSAAGLVAQSSSDKHSGSHGKHVVAGAAQAPPLEQADEGGEQGDPQDGQRHQHEAGQRQQIELHHVGSI